MIIGIDISTIPYGTGVSNYTLNLVRNLIKIDDKNTYKLFFSSLRLDLPEEIKSLNKANVKIYQFKLPPTLLQLVWNQLRLFPIELFIGKCDVFHTSDWTQPPTIKAKTITTIHDLTPFIFPEWHQLKVIKAHKNKLSCAVKKCSHFICVSENTKTDLIKLFPQIKKDSITVIYEAAEDKYARFLKFSQKEQEMKKDLIKRQYGLNKFILAQGTREPRKNLARLIEAFNLYKKKRPKSQIELAIAGKYGWGEDVNHLKNFSVKVLGFIPEKDMVALHASAVCLAYPSLYEGFGLPILKSMKVGVPVITSNVSSLPEITDHSALLIDPHSTKEISKALEKIINLKILRNRLIKKGIERAKIFSWSNTAKQTLSVYSKTFKN
jgi:glycosyltransferase involved in cell wall biosynthesis